MILRTREAALRDTLFTMRAMIDRFTLDNKRHSEAGQFPVWRAACNRARAFA
jgi:hypothetical protein